MIRALTLAVLVGWVGTVAAEEPQWLQDLRAREAAPVDSNVVRSADGWFRVKVPARVEGKVEEDDGSYAITFLLGTETAVNCELIKDGFDPAALLTRTAATSFELLGKEQGKIAQRAVERTNAGHIDGNPYIAVDWLYRVETPDGPKVGSLKQVVALKGGHGVYCVHNDVGYSKSFETLTREFVQSLQVTEGPAPAVYEDVSVMSIGAAKIGVATSSVARDEDGDFRVQMTMAMVLPVTADTLRAQDSIVIQFVRPEGSLINMKHVGAANGEIETELSLQPLEEGGWQVTGQHKGKALEGKLDTQHEPSTFLRQASLRKALLERPDPTGGENLEWQWLAADPLRLTEARLKVVGPAGEGLYKARESAGPLQADTVLERATGMTQRADIAIGANTMTVERVYSRGRL